MPGMIVKQLSVAPTCLHAPSAAGGLWDCALLGKLARGVLAIDRLPGAAAPNRGPSCTLHAIHCLRTIEMQKHQQEQRQSHSVCKPVRIQLAVYKPDIASHVLRQA